MARGESFSFRFVDPLWGLDVQSIALKDVEAEVFHIDPMRYVC